MLQSDIDGEHRTWRLFDSFEFTADQDERLGFEQRYVLGLADVQCFEHPFFVVTSTLENRTDGAKWCSFNKELHVNRSKKSPLLRAGRKGGENRFDLGLTYQLGAPDAISCTSPCTASNSLL